MMHAYIISSISTLCQAHMTAWAHVHARGASVTATLTFMCYVLNVHV